MWINIEKTGQYPPFPNQGKQFMSFDGTWQQPSFFHVDPTNGEKWWEDIFGNTIKERVTHWREMFENPVD